MPGRQGALRVDRAAVQVNLVEQLAVVGKGEGLPQVLILPEHGVAHVEGDIIDIEVAPYLKGDALFNEVSERSSCLVMTLSNCSWGMPEASRYPWRKRSQTGWAVGYDRVPDLVRQGQLFARVVKQPLFPVAGRARRGVKFGPESRVLLQHDPVLPLP